MYVTVRSSPFVPGARPSYSSDDSTLMCARTACGSIFGIAESGTCGDCPTACSSAGRSGAASLRLHAPTLTTSSVIRRIRFMPSLYSPLLAGLKAGTTEARQPSGRLADAECRPARSGGAGLQAGLTKCVTRQFLPFAGLQRPELDRAERDSHQARDLVAERGEHPPDLAILPLDELDDQVCFACGAFPHDDRLCRKAVDALHHAVDGRVVDRAAHGHCVSSNDSLGRIGQAIGELRVVGQEQDAGARHVEPSNGDQPVAGVTKHVEDGAAS